MQPPTPLTARDRLGSLDIRRILSIAIWLTGAVAIALAVGVAVRYLQLTSIAPWRGATPLPRVDLVVGAVVVAAAGAAIAGAALIAARRPRWALPYGLALVVATRLVALLALDGRLVSDYAGYWGIANGMLAGHGFWTSVPPGFPFLEAGAIAIGGRTIQSAELLNLVLSILAGLAIFDLTRRGWGVRAAAVALAAFALMPSQLLFTVVLGTEIAYGALLAVAAAAARRASAGGVAVVVACGVILGLSQYVRPTSLVVVPAVVVVFLLVAPSWRAWLRASVALVLAFSVTVLPIVAWNATENHRLSASASLFDKWTIYIGLNVASHGHYSTAERAKVSAAAGIPVVPSDSGVPGAVFSEPRLEAARAFNDAAGALLPARIRANGIRSLTMQPVKYAVMWQNADYPVGLVFGPLAPQPNDRVAAVAALLAQAAWVVLLLAALVALWRGRHARPVEAVLVLLVVLGAVAVHALAEVQPRYHEYFVPLLCVLAGAAAAPRVRSATPAPAAPETPDGDQGVTAVD